MVGPNRASRFPSTALGSFVVVASTSNIWFYSLPRTFSRCYTVVEVSFESDDIFPFGLESQPEFTL